MGEFSDKVVLVTGTGAVWAALLQKRSPLKALS